MTSNLGETNSWITHYFTRDIYKARLWNTPGYAKAACRRAGISENYVKTLTLLLNP
jgi:hypothetical protein